ncbi:MAG TPA: hypothetical protein VJ739_15710 [Gemmataceae bacterium]|nr:hypothetical protein [Gemmataceae bacterium]
MTTTPAFPYAWSYLVRACRPYRVVYLLSDDRSIKVYDREDFAYNNLRMPDAVDWRSVVHPLMGLAPIVAIDTRVASPAIVEEIRRIVEKDLLDKCVFIVTRSGTCPAIDQAINDSSIRARFHTIPDSQAIPFAKRIVKSFL